MTPAALAAAAENVLGGAGCGHRLVEVMSARLADELTPGLATLGYSRTDTLIMLWTGGEAARRPVVVELRLGARVAAATDSWREDLPGAGPEVAAQLGGRAATVADRETFLAVLAEDGSVAARADLYRHGDMAQVEDVATRPPHRGRGCASALVLDAVSRARSAGPPDCPPVGVFLLADRGDWPQQLYRRLGFTDLGSFATFTR